MVNYFCIDYVYFSLQNNIYKKEGRMNYEEKYKTCYSINAYCNDTFLTTGTVFAAAHIVPGTNPPRYCNNTIEYVIHTNSTGSVPGGYHTWQGLNCSITQVVYTHRYYCHCGYVFRSNIQKACETYHKLCGLKITGDCY